FRVTGLTSGGTLLHSRVDVPIPSTRSDGSSVFRAGGGGRLRCRHDPEPPPVDRLTGGRPTGTARGAGGRGDSRAVLRRLGQPGRAGGPLLAIVAGVLRRALRD